jgi:hypothetical protein
VRLTGRAKAQATGGAKVQATGGAKVQATGRAKVQATGRAKAQAQRLTVRGAAPPREHGGGSGLRGGSGVSPYTQSTPKPRSTAQIPLSVFRCE